MSQLRDIPDVLADAGVPRAQPRHGRLALIVALAVSGYAVLVYAAILPSHIHSGIQAVTGPMNAIDSLLQLPGRVVVWMLRTAVLRGAHFWLPFGWFLGVLATAVFYFGLTLFTARIYTRLVSGRARDPNAHAPVSEPLKPVTRRRFLARSTQAVGVGLVAGFGYGVVIEPRWLEITRRRIGIRDLPAALDGLRIVQITDIHHGPWLGRDFIGAVVDAGNSLEPDLFLLTGDFVHQAAEFIEPVAQELARLRPRIGTVAVLGNHDWWEDVSLVRAALAHVDIPLIDNARRVLTPDRRLRAEADDGLAICGVGDLWEDRQDYAAALKGLPDAMPRLLLSHNPDVAEERRFTGSGLRVDLMISGHTHGGQVRIPFMGTPVVPSRFGQKYAQGLVQGPTCPVFICRGIGMSGLPIRLGVRPEIALLELTAST